MKIISQISDEKYLISVTNEELAHLMGLYSAYKLDRREIEGVIKSEAHVPISKIFMKHQQIAQIQRESKKAREELTKMLEALTPIEAIFPGFETATVK